MDDIIGGVMDPITGFITGIVDLIVLIFIVVIIVIIVRGGMVIVVKQQENVIIERLGKFARIIGPGLHLKLPFAERKAATVSMRTDRNEFEIDAKTQDNVTINMQVSAQFHVDYNWGNTAMESGVYKSYYTLAHPVEQMRDFLIDALRSSIPVYTLDEVFAKKDEIANDVNETVGERMSEYGFVLVQTLITQIKLPADVERSMNAINSAQRDRAAAQDLAEADRIKRVTEARAEAESMEQTGIGIANQRKAIADGIKESLDTIKESGVSPREANELFMFTQWADMMTTFAREGGSSTIVLPSDFNQTANMFSQMLAAEKAAGDDTADAADALASAAQSMQQSAQMMRQAPQAQPQPYSAASQDPVASVDQTALLLNRATDELKKKFGDERVEQAKSVIDELARRYGRMQ